MTTYIGNKPELTKVRDEYIGISPNGDAGANAAGIPFDPTGNTYVLGATVQAALDSTDTAMLTNDTLRLTNRDATLTAIASPELDLNDIIKSGNYNIGATELNRPADDGVLIHQERNNVQASQLFYGALLGDSYIRVRSGAGTWTVWDRITQNLHKEGDTMSGDLILANTVSVSGTQVGAAVTSLLGIDAIDVVYIGPVDSPTLNVEARGIWDFFDAVPSTPFSPVGPEDLTRRDYVDSRLLTNSDTLRSSVDYALDLDDLVVSGVYRPVVGATNTPLGNLNGALTVTRNDDLCIQHYIHNATGEIFVRSASSVLAIPIWIPWTAQPNQAATDLRYLRKDQNDTTIGSITISNNSPIFDLYNTANALDEKRWRLRAAATSLTHQAMPDVGSAPTTYMQVDRVGTTVSKISLFATELVMDGAVEIFSSSPILKLTNAAGGIDGKKWRTFAAGSSLLWDALNDAEGVSSVFMRVDRTGVTVDKITLTATEVDIVGTLLNNGLPIGGGGGAESGTFLPVLQDFSLTPDGATYSQQVGNWMKVGGMMFVSGVITLSSLGSLTTAEWAAIGGLPEACAAGRWGTASIGFAQSLGILTAGQSLTGYVVPGESRIRMRIWSTVTGNTDFLISGVSSNGSMSFSAMYPVAP